MGRVLVYLAGLLMSRVLVFLAGLLTDGGTPVRREAHYCPGIGDSVPPIAKREKSGTGWAGQGQGSAAGRREGTAGGRQGKRNPAGRLACRRADDLQAGG